LLKNNSEVFHTLAGALHERRNRFATWACAYLLMVATCSVSALAQINVYTRSYDNARSGGNLQETTLTPANVNANSFGKLFTVHTDGQIFAQPLYVSGLTIAGGTHNVVFVASMRNTVYAIDADSGTVLWQQNFGPPIVPQDVESDQNIVWTTGLGILGTPVIDPATNYMYFVSGEQPPGTYNYSWNLNAIDITTGQPVHGSPVAIAATYSTADLTSPLIFNAGIQNPRPGLALANGNVYIGFASHEDRNAYHGWVLAYSTSTLAQTAVYVDTTSGYQGGIWNAGQAPSVDAAGNLYISTGNGSYGTTANNLVQTGNSFIKLSPTLELLDYFTPFNSTGLNNGDQDLGASGLLLIPNTNYVLGGGKQGVLYLADTGNLGKFNASGDQVRQEFQAVYGTGTSHIHGGPIFFNDDANGPSIYTWGENDHLRGFEFNATTSLINPTPFAESTMTAPATNNNSAMPGGFLSVSANNNQNGIVWASTPFDADAVHQSVRGVLYAFDAATLNLLWTDKTNDARDDVGMFAKYVPPVVANGKMYIPNFGPYYSNDGSGNLLCYGLLATTPVLTVSANNASRVFGAANPTFTGAVTGAQNGDTFTETFSTTATPTSAVGNYPIVPTASGTDLGNYTVNTVNGTLTVTAAPTTTTLSAPASATPGASVALTATVASTAGIPGGTVTFYSGTTSLGTGTLDAGGVAALSTTTLATGTDSLTASYAAAGNFTGSTSPAIAITISASAQTITFPAIAAHVYGSAPFGVSATSSLGSGYPVTISVQSGPATISGGVVTVIAVGTVVLQASQAGDAQHNAATATQSFQVTPAALSVTAANASRVFGAANPTFTGTVTGAVGSDIFNETFTTTATAASNVGTYPIVPAVTGPVSNYTVTTTNGTLTVNGAPTTTAVSAPTSATSGSSVTLTATVTSTAGTPGGSVTFSTGATSLGTGTLAGGVASLDTTALPAGSDTVTATYAAAGNFAGSSGTANLSIAAPVPAAYAVSANPTSLTVQMGSAGNTMLTFTPSGGYSGNVALTCSNLPANASCAFAQSQVKLTGNNQSVTIGLTISATVQSSSRGNPASPALLALAFWWPGGLTGLAVLVRKRRSKMPRVAQLCLLLLCTCAFAAVLSGCGSGNGASMSQPTTSQVTVLATGTAASGVTTQSVVLSLTVTQ
jgi:MBG domain (YGX type)/Bacterial Ig-like domain (group 3)/PQQ enzyme repeat